MGREGSSYGIDEWLELKYWAIGGIAGAGDRRAARLPRVHGEAPRGAAALRGGGHPLQQEILGGLVGAFTTEIGALSTYSTLWRYESFADREERRARLAGRPRWKEFLAKVQPLFHTQQNRDPRPDVVLAASVMGALDGKVAIVTGGAQGIGAAIAAGLEAEGAEVVIADLEPPEGGIRADVSSESDVSRMVGEALERNGRIDILVNNAGLYASLEMRAFTEIPLEEWNRVMEVNVASMFLTSRAVVPGHARAGRREDREHLVGHALSRRPVPPALRDVEGRDRRLHARAREGARPRLDPRELRRARLHDVGRREVASRGDREAPRRLGRVADAAARPGARGRRRRGRLPLHARRPTSSRARRWSSTAASTSIDLRALPVGPRRADRIEHELEDGTRLVWEVLDHELAEAVVAAEVVVESGVDRSSRSGRLSAGRRRVPARASGAGDPPDPARRADDRPRRRRRADVSRRRGVVRGRG